MSGQAKPSERKILFRVVDNPDGDFVEVWFSRRALGQDWRRNEQMVRRVAGGLTMNDVAAIHSVNKSCVHDVLARFMRCFTGLRVPEGARWRGVSETVRRYRGWVRKALDRYVEILEESA